MIKSTTLLQYQLNIKKSCPYCQHLVFLLKLLITHINGWCYIKLLLILYDKIKIARSTFVATLQPYTRNFKHGATSATPPHILLIYKTITILYSLVRDIL